MMIMSKDKTVKCPYCSDVYLAKEIIILKIKTHQKVIICPFCRCVLGGTYYG